MSNTNSDRDNYAASEIIYNSAADNRILPEVLEALVNSMESHESSDDHSISETLNYLLPHLKNAQKIVNKIDEYKKHSHYSEGLFESLPIGVILADSSGQIRKINNNALEIISTLNSLNVEDDFFTFRNEAKTSEFLSRIGSSLSSSSGDSNSIQILEIEEDDTSQAVKMIIFPHPKVNDLALIIMVHPHSELRISNSLLMSLYSLTKAEARLASEMISGASLNEIAEKLNISRSTVRAHLNSIFRKTNTSRQAELIRLLVTNPAVWIGGNREETAKKAIRIRKNTRLSRITLKDGRTLAFSQYGDPYGKPVILFHRNLGSRLDLRPEDSTPIKLGLRIIVPDRPGIGLSDRNPDLGFHNYSDDIVQLADQLELARFAVLGNNMGSCYGLGCAYRIPERLSNVLLVNAYPPFTSFSDYSKLSSMELIIAVLARRIPKTTIHILDPVFRKLQSRAEQHLYQMKENSCESDAELLSNKEIFDRLIESAKEAGHNGTYGVALEYVNLSRPWGFPLHDISIPVTLWFGENSHFIPQHSAELFAETIPTAIIKKFPTEGHFLFFTRFHELLGNIYDNIQ